MTVCTELVVDDDWLDRLWFVYEICNWLISIIEELNGNYNEETCDRLLDFLMKVWRIRRETVLPKERIMLCMHAIVNR